MAAARGWLNGRFYSIRGAGCLPGAGGNIAAFLSYNGAKNASSDPGGFGKGNPQGVAAAECGNNADNAAAMIPALSLGIPGNVVAALVLSALTIHGLQPGPLSLLLLVPSSCHARPHRRGYAPTRGDRHHDTTHLL